MLCQSTLAEYMEGTLSLSLFGVWTSSVIPIKEGVVAWWLNPPWETAQSGSISKGVASHILQWTCVNGIPISIVWQEFDHDLGLVLSLSFTPRGYPCVAPWFLISFPNPTAAFVTSSKLTGLIWYSSDLMEYTSITNSTISRLSA